MGKNPLRDPEDEDKGDRKKRDADAVRKHSDLSVDSWLTERLRVEAAAFRAANNIPYTSPLPCAGPNCGKRAVAGYFFCSRTCRVRYVATS